MKYLLKIDSREGYEKVEMFAPSVGMRLDDDEARRVIRYAAEHYGIVAASHPSAPGPYSEMP